MRTTISDHDLNWSDKLSEIIWGINHTFNDSIKHTPFDLLFGYKSSLQGNLENAFCSVENLKDVAV